MRRAPARSVDPEAKMPNLHRDQRRFVGFFLALCALSFSAAALSADDESADAQSAQLSRHRSLGPGPEGYSIVDLGTFGPFTNASTVQVSDINDSGEIVGAEFSLGPTGVAAFSYTLAGGMVDLNALPASGRNSLATGINDKGDIAFMADRSGGAGGYIPAIVSGGVVQALPLLTDPGYSSVPPASYYTTRINVSGDVVGTAFASSGSTAPPFSLPFLANLGSIRSLGSLGGQRGGAAAINGRGEVVGFSELASTPVGDMWNPGHAFRYTARDGMVDLNQLIRGGAGPWELRAASAINKHGEIVGFGAFNSSSGAVLRAFRFHEGEVRNLGTSPNGGISAALGINDRGQIVGYAYFDASGVGNFRACIFLPELGAIDLNYLINPALGWNLLRATAINNSGQIVGYGTLAGMPGIRGFLLTPTE
jgi:probable HAF family extracellular repeat protein